MVGVTRSRAILFAIAAVLLWWCAARQSGREDSLPVRARALLDPPQVTSPRPSAENAPVERLPFREAAEDRAEMGKIQGRFIGDISGIAGANVHVIRCAPPLGETLSVEVIASPIVRDTGFESEVEPGIYGLRIEVMDNGRTLYAAIDPFPVGAGETVVKHVPLNGDTVITGRVQWEDGAPVKALPMLAIPMMDLRFSCSVITGDDGRFRIEGLVDGMSGDHGIHVTCPRTPPGTVLRPRTDGPELRPWSQPFDFILRRLHVVQCSVILMYEGPVAAGETVPAGWLIDTGERKQSELQDCVLRRGSNLLMRMQWDNDAPPTQPTVQLESTFGYARMPLRRVAHDRLVATLGRWHPLVNTVTLAVPERMLAPDRRGVFLNRHEFNGGRYRQAILTGNTARFENVVPGTYWVRSLGRIAWEDPYGRLVIRPDGSHSSVADWRR